ncbi:hypothetical protein TSAR_016779 [Trichomalopsis sarcophagae]|uniref:GH18 domain-containing protein n=1 Tax=Trichomalopsis sarcophagae TaxID=543379 RepID=A0A232F646_9HYME|nr:hypothetical protein TSAR_016779 [Trichomalopsis sarcophagae]
MEESKSLLKKSLDFVQGCCSPKHEMTTSNDRKVICYYGSWSVYRPGLGKFDISHIDSSLCTHLIYAFAGLGESGQVKVLDPWNDLPDGGGKDGYRKFNALRKDNPELKTMIGMGGWNEGSSKYSSLAANETTREKFADNVVEFLKKYGFNGFDLDWEYPCQRGGSPSDKENFVQLLKTLRKRFDRESVPLVLSAAVASAEISAGKSYDISSVCESLDFVNVMCYDLHGSWDKKTGVNAPLYPGSWETDFEKKLNVDSCIQYWLSQGAPAEKLVLGVPFYGRGFTLANASQSSGIGAPAYSGSEPGPYTREAGMLGYNEILEDIAKGWQVHFQEEQKVPYAVHGNQWVGYDDERSLKDKTDYIKKHGLGGAMAWSIETDDFLGTAGKKYPLLNVLHRELRGDGATYYTD